MDFRDVQKLSTDSLFGTISFSLDSRELLTSNKGRLISWRLDNQGQFQPMTHGYIKDAMRTRHDFHSMRVYEGELLINIEKKAERKLEFEARVWKRISSKYNSEDEVSRFREVQTRDVGDVRSEFGPPQFCCSSNGTKYLEIPSDNSLFPVRLWKYRNDGLFYLAFETRLPIETPWRETRSQAENSPNGRWLVYWTGFRWMTGPREKHPDKRTDILEITDEGIHQRISLGDQRTTSAAFSPDSQLLATIVFPPGDIIIWRLNDEDVFVYEQTIKGDEMSWFLDTSLAFSPDNIFLLMVTLGCKVRIWVNMAEEDATESVYDGGLHESLHGDDSSESEMDHPMYKLWRKSDGVLSSI